MSAADLQGQLANTDWGLLTGTRVVKLKTGPAKHALEIDLASAPSVSKAASGERAGVGFNWAPQSFGRPRAACLSYSVFLPDGFTFGRGGRLPGFAGASATETGEPETAFSTRYTWSADGEAEIYAQLPDWPEGRSLGGKREKLALQPGRWTELEQEVVLNSPGKADGVLRVWQDGRLVMQRSDVLFRMKPSVMLSGVLAEASAGDPVADTKPGPQKIWLTPFELRWQ